jgi:hypothetical protein
MPAFFSLSFATSDASFTTPLSHLLFYFYSLENPRLQFKQLELFIARYSLLR